jgi:hypothetical protein
MGAKATDGAGRALRLAIEVSAMTASLRTNASVFSAS